MNVFRISKEEKQIKKIGKEVYFKNHKN